MIKFLAERGGRPMIGLGLSRKNCETLLDGKPIFIDLLVMMKDVNPPPDLSRATVLIFAGEDETSMQESLSQFAVLPSERHVHHEEN